MKLRKTNQIYYFINNKTNYVGSCAFVSCNGCRLQVNDRYCKQLTRGPANGFSELAIEYKKQRRF